jgi:CHAT domain-containing protein
LSNKKKEQNKFLTKDNFIGFAPVFDSKNNNGFIVSNEWILDTTNTEMACRSISNNFTHFNTLPYSENEVESIVKLFNRKRKEAKGFFFKEANEENFKNNIHNYKYIHIASHSFTNDQYPNLSGIAFSQPDTSAVYNEDGILYAGETYNLNLPKADLITLSSCKSGLGKLIQGEGFLSLSRGFLYSGAPNIIFSLWNVKDEPTKDLMIHFYKKVLQETDYANALREAKIQLISNPKTASPKYWGAWMLVGR